MGIKPYPKKITLTRITFEVLPEKARVLPQGLIYMEDTIGNNCFFIEALVPALMAPQYVPRSKAMTHSPDTSLIEGTVRVFWIRDVDPKLKKAVIEKCQIVLVENSLSYHSSV